MDNVNVHYNSSQPARLNALAYAQGRDIHVAPGQERHLPHEAWHAVQQAQGRVKPRMQLKAGVTVNDDEALEREADLMGAKALASAPPLTGVPVSRPLRQAGGGDGQLDVIQRAVGFEIETNWRVYNYDQTKNNNGPLKNVQKREYFEAGWPPAYLTNNLAKGDTIIRGNHFELQVDELPSGGKDLEFVTTLPAFDETQAGRDAADTTLTAIETLAGRLVNSQYWAIEPTDLGVGGVNTPTAVMRRNTTRGMNGSPQTTGAIRLDRIPTLFETIGTKAGDLDPSKAEGRTRLMGVSDGQNPPTQTDIEKGIQAGILGDAPAAARQALANHQQRFSERFAGWWPRYTRQANIAEAIKLNSSELIGLVSLAVTYLQIADRAQPSYVKKIAPLMARTDFARMFQLLPQHERQHFQDHKESWVRLVLEAAGLPGTGSTPVLSHGIGSNPQQDILHWVTRDAWLRGIVSGRDLMSTAGFAAQYPNEPGGAEFEAMGRKGAATEQVGPNAATAAPIFELRRMKGGVDYLEWKPLLLRVFDFLKKMNNPGAPNPRL
jgi:hypothetical protein